MERIRCTLCGSHRLPEGGCMISSCPLHVGRALIEQDNSFKIKPPLPAGIEDTLEVRARAQSYVETGNFDQTPVVKPPTLDTAPHDLAHAPEVPHHRFSVFHESGDYAYARGLEINPTHLPIALDAMAKSGWHLVSIFGQTDSKHIGAIFRRQPDNDLWEQCLALAIRDRDRATARSDELHRVNSDLIEQRRASDAVCVDLSKKIDSLENLVLTRSQELADQDERINALQKFKEYVHERLDYAGVPLDPGGPHSANGCRVGDRLDMVLAPFPRGDPKLAVSHKKHMVHVPPFPRGDEE